MANRFMRALMVAFAVLGTSSTACANPHAQVSLLSETDHPRAGSTFLIGIRIVPAPGWHSYWSNPGDSGIPPTIRWKAMRGLHFGPLLHPAPTLLKVSGATSYVHAGEHILLARVRADPTMKRGTTLPIEARLMWATCSTSLCVPERTTLSLNLRVGEGIPTASASGLRLAVQRLPHRLAEGVFRTRGGLVRMEVPKAAKVDLAQSIFFPSSSGMIAAATLHVRMEQGKPEILGRILDNTRSRISGVLADGKRSYLLSFHKAK
jgi:DsbC/DsbD-like thiol-disulfide interchange protein